jgi:hypothetical protein
MRILLQQIGSGLYVKDGGEWRKTPDEALCFSNAEIAQSYSNFEALPDTFVVMLPDAPQSDNVPAATNIVEMRTATQWRAS